MHLDGVGKERWGRTGVEPEELLWPSLLKGRAGQQGWGPEAGEAPLDDEGAGTCRLRLPREGGVRLSAEACRLRAVNGAGRGQPRGRVTGPRAHAPLAHFAAFLSGREHQGRRAQAHTSLGTSVLWPTRQPLKCGSALASHGSSASLLADFHPRGPAHRHLKHRPSRSPQNGLSCFPFLPAPHTPTTSWTVSEALGCGDSERHQGASSQQARGR